MQNLDRPYEVVLINGPVINHLKGFTTYAEAKLWADNFVRPIFPTAKIEIVLRKEKDK